ncbi:response regulator transcription factor [Allofustis seminis]|uniref:response regulator transcription factor n=1 Tax=Allofustis seminis TaxID=166939 RepID=UPI0003645377|nr:response regulator transcription factor [Allofustis seminis]
MKILIVEDDHFIRQMLGDELEKWGFIVAEVDDFHQTLATFQQECPQLVLMDIKLPIFDGYYFTQEIRKISQVPIIFISSQADQMTQIMAIEMGADDFIVKPFAMSLVISKIKALLRRTYMYDGASDLKSKIDYDETKLTLTYHHKKVELTKTENLLLNALWTKKNHYVSGNDLIDTCWESEQFIDDNTLFVNMSRLRKKLASIGLPDVIETKKNVGYKFNEEDL